MHFASFLRQVFASMLYSNSGNKQCSKSEFRKDSGNCWHNRVVGCQRTTDCYRCCGAYWWVGSTILWRVGLHQWRWKWYTICWNDACRLTSGQLLTWQPSSLAVKFSLALSPETSALLHCMPSKVLCFEILCVIGVNPFQVLSLAFYEYWLTNPIGGVQWLLIGSGSKDLYKIHITPCAHNRLDRGGEIVTKHCKWCWWPCKCWSDLLS